MNAESIGDLLDEANPELPGIDGGRLAIEREYAKESLAAAFAAFLGARESNIERLRALSTSDFEKTGRFQDVGQPPVPMTLGKLVANALAHDREHIEMIRAIVGSHALPAR